MSVNLGEHWHPPGGAEATFQNNPLHESAEKTREEEVSQKKSGVWTQVRVVASSSKAIKPALKYIGAILAAGITFKPSDRKYKVSLIHAFYDFVAIWNNFYFGADSVGNARNIGKKENFNSEATTKEVEELIAFFDRTPANEVLNKVWVATDKIKRESEDTGVCLGVRIDTVQRYLHGESLLEIIKSNEDGASPEAVASQLVNEMLGIWPEDLSNTMDNLFKELSSLSKNKDGYQLFEADFNVVKQSLFQAEPTLRKDPPLKEYAVFQTQKLPDEQLTGLPRLIREVVDQEVQEFRIADRSDLFIGRRREDHKATLKDPLAFQQAVLAKINENFIRDVKGKQGKELNELVQQREQDVRTLAWTVSLLQYKQGLDLPEFLEKKKLDKEERRIETAKLATDFITDPVVKHTLFHLTSMRPNLYREAAILHAYGIKMVDLAEVVGDSGKHPTDAAFLQQFPKLAPGTYGITFQQKEGYHGITYVKISDQEGYILDPNGYQIKCRGDENTIEQFKKLMKLYPAPSLPSPSAPIPQENHHLMIKKYELEVQDTT